METAPITIEVPAAAAAAYAAATGERREKIQLLLGLQLQELFQLPVRPLGEVMDEVAAEAAANGLTPEILESLLRDDAQQTG